MTVFDRKGANMYRLLTLAIAASTGLGVLLILPATAGAQQRPPIVEKLAKTYGLESFGQIEAIRYTFTVQSRTRSRSIMDLGTQNRPGHL
jgi:predicted aldo/keto reductase-like oxidoreductase